MTAKPGCLDAGLAYAQLGWQAVPLNWPRIEDGVTVCSCQRRGDCASPGKHPWVRWRDTGGSTDLAVIRQWWRARPRSGVGILTGRARSGLFVVDVDPDHGGEATIADLEAVHGPLPATLTAITGSGGRHLIFGYPTSDIRQRAGALGPGVDTRSDGGLIVAAPSLHKSGRRYRWVNWGTEPTEVPGWLLELLAPRLPTPAGVPVPRRHTFAGSRYGQVALERTVAELAGFSDAIGCRNDALNRAAWSMGRLVGAGLLDAVNVGNQLVAVAVAIGLGEKEAEDTIASGLRAGARSPRTVAAS